MTILNLTQHKASPEQVAAGVMDVTDQEDRQWLQHNLTFSDVPNRDQVRVVARNIARLASEYDCEEAMIGGALWLMRPLEEELEAVDIKPVYAFSVRESFEKVVNGSVCKTSKFTHKGFVR